MRGGEGSISDNSLCRSRRAPHPHAVLIDNHDAAGELGEIFGFDEGLDKPADRLESEGGRSEQDNSWMATGRELPQIGESDVQRENHSALRTGGCSNFRIGPPEKPLLLGAGCVVSSLLQQRLKVFGEILIELDLHAAVSLQVFSCASSAA